MHLFSWALFHSCDSLVNSYMEKKGRYFQPFLQKTELHKKVRRCDSHPFWYSKGKQKYSSSGGAGPLHLQGCHSGTSSYFQPTSQHLRLRLLLPLWPAVTCLLRRFLLVPAPRTQCSLACGPRAGDEQLHLPSRSTRSTSMSAPDCSPSRCCTSPLSNTSHAAIYSSTCGAGHTAGVSGFPNFCALRSTQLQPPLCGRRSFHF